MCKSILVLYRLTCYNRYSKSSDLIETLIWWGFDNRTGEFDTRLCQIPCIALPCPGVGGNIGRCIAGQEMIFQLGSFTCKTDGSTEHRLRIRWILHCHTILCPTWH